MKVHLIIVHIYIHACIYVNVKVLLFTCINICENTSLPDIPKYRIFLCAVFFNWISLNHLEIGEINFVKCPCPGGIHPLFHDQKTIFLISRLTIFDDKYAEINQVSIEFTPGK